MEYINKVHEWLKPAQSMYMAEAFCYDYVCKVPAHNLYLNSFNMMSISPGFVLENPFYTEMRREINLQDIFCRIHVFNVCSRNLNYSNSGGYLTFDLYMQNKYLRADWPQYFGPVPPASAKILTDTNLQQLEEINPIPYVLSDKDEVEGTIYFDFCEHMPEIPRVDMNNLIMVDGINIYMDIGDIFNIGFDDVFCNFYIDAESEKAYNYIRYAGGDIYVKKGYAVRGFETGKMQWHIVEVKDLKDARKKSKKAICPYPFLDEKALGNMVAFFGRETNIDPTVMWVETNPIIDFIVESLHRKWPEMLINCVGTCMPRFYVNQYEILENWKIIMPDEGDFILNLSDYSKH